MLKDDDYKELFEVLRAELFSSGFSEITFDLSNEEEFFQKIESYQYKHLIYVMLLRFSERLSLMDKSLFDTSIQKIRETLSSDNFPTGAVVYDSTFSGKDQLFSRDQLSCNLADAPDFSSLRDRIHNFQLRISGEVDE